MPRSRARTTRPSDSVRVVRLQGRLCEQSGVSQCCWEEHVQHMPATLIPHLYSQSAPVRALRKVWGGQFDDLDGVAIGSQPVRKLDTLVITDLFVVRQEIKIEAHW